MRIESSIDVAFKPVTITITLENANELKCLKDIISNQTVHSICNTDLGQTNFKDSTKHKAFATDFLRGIYRQIKNI